MGERVLLIDDDVNLLAGLQRQLRKIFDIVTAEGGAAALAAVEAAQADHKPFAVALCDMRMPGMDGIEVLRRIKDLAPDTVRMMLTGNADQETAINAINHGNIFRFFTKPCPAETLAEGLAAGVEQYRLITAERDLLEKTVAGSLKMLVDVVSMNDPVAYGQATRLREWVRLLTIEFKMPQRWVLEMAATLVPIGQVAVPFELQTKKRQGEELTETERQIFERAPEAARNLISNIPRLGKVAEIVYLQDRGFDGSGFPADGPVGDAIPLDARLLKILKDLSEVSGSNSPSANAFAQLEKNGARYDPLLLRKVRACLEIQGAQTVPTEADLPVSALRPGHFVMTDIKLANGHLILAANTLLSGVQIERLRALRKIFPFAEPVRVRIN